MSATLYYGYYSKKCIDKDVLPFLEYYNSCCDLCANHMPKGFYDGCRELSVYDEQNECYIFNDYINLFEFASRKEVPSILSDYIADNYNDEIPTFIIWVR